MAAPEDEGQKAWEKGGAKFNRFVGAPHFRFKLQKCGEEWRWSSSLTHATCTARDIVNTLTHVRKLPIGA